MTLTNELAAGERFCRGKGYTSALSRAARPRGRRPKSDAERGGGIALQHRGVVHPVEARQLGFEMAHRAQVRVLRVEKTKGALQQMEKLRRGMFRLGADLDQLDEVGSRLRAEIIFANPGERDCARPPRSAYEDSSSGCA